MPSTGIAICHRGTSACPEKNTSLAIPIVAST